MKLGIIIILIVGVLGWILSLRDSYHKGYVKELDYHFGGVVDSVTYDIKGKATIIIKSAHYALEFPDWNFDSNKIEKGDSIIKKRNSMIITLVKKNGQIIVEGTTR